MERIAALQKTTFVRVGKLVFFTFLALFSAITGCIELAEQFTDYNDYQWHTSNPEEGNRCVPFFDKAKAVAKDTDSDVMYNYNLENAAVIFCTDKPRSSFDSELSSGKFYDQLLDVSHGNCSLPTASNATCVPTPTCVAPELNIAPVPYGVMWEYEIEGTNSTNFTTPCGVKFTKMDMTYEACTKAHVHVYRYSAGSGAYLVFMISISYVIVRFGLELAGVIAFHKKCCTSCGKEGKDSVLFGIAAGGLFGPLYSFGELISKRDVNMITEAADLPLPVEVVLLFLDTLPSVVLPIYAMSGCSFENVKLILLLVFGLVKTALSLAKTIYDLTGTHCSDKKGDPLDGKDTKLPAPLLVDQGGYPDTYNPAQSTMSSPLSPHNQQQHQQQQGHYQQQQQQHYSPHQQQQQYQPQQYHPQQQQQWTPPQNQYPQAPQNHYVQAEHQIEL